MSFQDFLPFEVSGENNFTLTTAEIVKDAFDILQIGVDGEGVSSDDYDRAIRALNLVMREMQAQGLHITSYRAGYIFLEEGKVEYVPENASDSKATNKYYCTTTTAAVTAPTTTVPVTDASNMTEGDQFGVLRDDSTIFWTTIDTITTTTSPAADITIADAFVGSADSGTTVINYTSGIEPIARVLKTLRRDNFTTDVPISLLARDEYEHLPFKETTEGLPSQAYYWRSERRGTMFVWPPPANDTYIMRLWYEARIDDLKDPTDRLDLDRAYLPAIVHTLALRLCQRFGISTEIYQRVKVEQQEIMNNVLSYDDEVGPISVSIQRYNW